MISVAAERDRGEMVKDASEISTKRVLIIKDEMFIAMDLASILRDARKDVVGIAADTEEALKLARREHPDLVLMDIRLAGGSDGVEAATRLRSELDVPCIFVSANEDDATRARATPARPIAWIEKPLQSREVVRVVCAFFRSEGGEVGKGSG